jgi:hypothetical protein
MKMTTTKKYRWNITNPRGAHLMYVISTSKKGALRQARKQWSGPLVAVELDRA